ncbi:hypothetical protein [Clostridium beijerinckii]|uniref:Uncharacterized protein n=1 Tax=Clostridium beijerinckii TaxID=1520 RepID=A0A1S9N2P8_CLOBE|nr:hypothetical protein [Clostridium beijerinckii]MZK49206.1 hypothetical protein [Clostridium beijerinckii]MZK57037.1 hypothetical protein [Clostridium beijerinckii]MZK67248.1 hypothetical protein [Clostridium beijerinckii]MZK72874.1 hypothetical protein [Clostridium beijerinckii]MZK82471.1 hypothetical protein [Clostridium beijerinckii]
MMGFMGILLSMFAMGMMQLVLATALPYIVNRRAIFSAIISGAIMYGLITILPLCGIAFMKQGALINESRILFL